MQQAPQGTIATRLTLALTHARLTQKELADAVGVHPRLISNIATGKRPGRQHLAAIAQKVGVPLDWLVQGTNAPAWAEGPNAIRPAPETMDNLVELYARRLEEAARRFGGLATYKAGGSEVPSKLGPLVFGNAPDHVLQYLKLDALVPDHVTLKLGFSELLAVFHLLNRAVRGEEETEPPSELERSIIKEVRSELIGQISGDDEIEWPAAAGLLERLRSTVVEAQRRFEEA